SHPGYGDDKQWSHPAVEIARNAVRPYRLCNLPEKETYKEFEKAYSAACDQLINGRDSKQIEHAKTNLSAVELNWARLYKKCIDEKLDALKSDFFPSREICIKAESLYHKWEGR